MKKLKCIIKMPGEEYGTMTTIPDDLSTLQAAVGGYIETVTIGPGLVIICDEEGRLKGYPHNCRVGGFDFVGTIIAIGFDGPELDDIGITWEEWKEMLGDVSN